MEQEYMVLYYEPVLDTFLWYGPMTEEQAHEMIDEDPEMVIFSEE